MESLRGSGSFADEWGYGCAAPVLRSWTPRSATTRQAVLLEIR